MGEGPTGAGRSRDDSRGLWSSDEGDFFLLKGLCEDLSPSVMVGEMDWLAGRELGFFGTKSQAVMYCGLGCACDEDSEGRPLIAVKVGAKAFPSLSSDMNGAVLMAGKCSTADMVHDQKKAHQQVFPLVEISLSGRLVVLYCRWFRRGSSELRCLLAKH